MKVKLFEEYAYGSFNVTITEQHIKYYVELQERISTLAFIVYEKENGEDFSEDGYVDWSETWVDSILTEKEFDITLNDEHGETIVSVPTELIYHPENVDVYYSSKKFNL
jgi:hypothetical protein